MPDAIDRFLEQRNSSIDYEALMSDELKKLDSVQAPSSLFKYFPPARSNFFAEPKLRFTQRTALNDPFELMKRWNEFASKPMRTALSEDVKTAFQNLTESEALEIFRDEAAKHGIILSLDQMAEASRFLSTDEGRQFNKVIANAISEVDQTVDTAFDYMTESADERLNDLTSNWGILSLCDNPSARTMWSLYASSGTGFMVEFDTNHLFFKAPNQRNLVWPVTYRDEPAASFFENPPALFLTKHTDYVFEREWRMIKPISMCAIHEGDVHLDPVLPGMIRSISFGYDYDSDKLAKHGAQIVAFDPNIRLRRAVANRSSGTFEFHDLS